MLTELPSFLTSPSPTNIKCSFHKSNPASSFCLDCNQFICLDSTCGHPHVFHSLESTSTLISSLLIPTLNSLISINKAKESNTKYVSSLNKIKNNLKNFSIDEKEKINIQYKKLLSSLQVIYSEYLSQIDALTESINEKFNNLLKRLLGTDPENDSNLYKINEEVNQMIVSSNGNLEKFISGVGKKINWYKKSLNDYALNFHKNEILIGDNFDKEVTEIKNYVKENYSLIENKGELFFSDSNSNLNQKIEKVKEESLLFKQKLQSEKKTEKNKISTVKISCLGSKLPGIDLDLFSRELMFTINMYRENPEKLLNEISNNLYFNDNSIFSFSQKKKKDYVKNYLQMLKKSRPKFEWDNDLSNSSEDYFKSTNGKLEKNSTALNSEIKKILKLSYYSENDYLNMIKTISYYKGKPIIDDIIQFILFNEDNWNPISGENFLFDESYNLIGIFATPLITNANLINMIINVGYFKREDEEKE